MNDFTVLMIVMIGGVAGLAIVGVALWTMRQEPAAGQPKPGVESANDAKAADATTAGNGNESGGVDWMSQLRANAPDVPPTEPANEPPESLPSAPTTNTEPAPTPVPAVSESSETVTQTAPTPAATTPSSTPGWLGSLASRVTTPAPPTAPAVQELLRLLRSPEGDLIVEVYGKRYRSRLEITDAPIEQQIANAINDLSRFLADTESETLKATPAAALKPLPTPTSNKKDLADTRPVVKVSLQEAAQMEMKQPSMDIMRQWRYVRDQQKKPTVQIKSVMEEIDEILQVMLIGTPWTGRGLKASDGSHGAVFSLDGKNYDSVDALPDPEAREMLRTAIQKWDQK